MAQQLTHHTCNGCNVNPGDLFGTGTISAPDDYAPGRSFGSLIEMTWGGRNEFTLDGGKVTRKYLEDGDVCVMKGSIEKDGIRVGFGECSTEILPAKKYPGI